MDKITPINDFILLEQPKNTESKVVIPGTVNKGAMIPGSRLLVISVGEGCNKVQPGDRILCDYDNAMMPFNLEGRVVYITNEKNVCAVIRNSA
ncbi:MAG: hypothetical protein KAS32_05980 [Candidatus Peribacteraceae bacterium]|nr:hypothetical protein [Candidatus Peribacteraceae bacterium]